MRALVRVARTIVIGAAVLAVSAVPAHAGPLRAVPGAPSVQPPTASCFQFPYFGPKGHANFDFGREIVRLLDERGVRVRGIAPIEAKPANRGVYMPIGWKRDHIDPCNGVYYPGGFVLHDVRSGHEAAIHDIYLRPDGAHAQVSIDGEPQGERLVATYRLHEFAAGVPTPRPLEGGVGPRYWPFYVSAYLSRTVRDLTGLPLDEGDYLANLDAVVQYVP
ncbi:hypothetical protein ACGFJC_10765 [Nonomuraea fuscirosea]|uniref:hypothetical protein n=1 Tax=Nonomuraea fuscirosea TaxID=1291556 RepID=UPI001C6287BB|nr:hypothetical protein [Nonomuraea fuscirosea]